MNKYQKNLLDSRNNLMNKMIEKIDNIVTKFAKQNKIDIVMLKSSVPYVSDRLDITDIILRKLNSSSKK